MAKFNAVRFFLLVSLIIYPTWALEVFLANDNGNYNIHTKINVESKNGLKLYAGGTHDRYTTGIYTYKVILYVVSPERFHEIMRPELRDERMKIRKELFNRICYELFYMAIKDFQKQQDESIIRNFICDTIKQYTQTPFKRFVFTTIGDIDLEVTIVLPSYATVTEFQKYKEHKLVFEANLRRHLEAIRLKKPIPGLIRIRN